MTLARSCAVVLGLILSSACAATVTFTPVTRIPLKVGNVPPVGQGQDEPVLRCAGTEAKPVQSSTGPDGMSVGYNSQTLDIKLDNGLVVSGNSNGGILLKGAGRVVETLHMPPTPNSQYRASRLGIPAHAGSILQMTLLTDGNTLITRGNDNTIRVWDIDKRKMLSLYTGGQEYCLIDGQKALIRTIMPVEIQKWDIKAQRLMWRNKNPSVLGTSHFHRVEGNTLFTRSQTINITSGKTLGYLRGNSVVFSPDNRLLALYNTTSYRDADKSTIADVFRISGFYLQSIEKPILRNDISIYSPSYIDLAFSPDSKVISILKTVMGKMTIERFTSTIEVNGYDLDHSQFLNSQAKTFRCGSETDKKGFINMKMYYYTFDGSGLLYYSPKEGKFVGSPNTKSYDTFFQFGTRHVDDLTTVMAVRNTPINLTSYSQFLYPSKGGFCGYFDEMQGKVPFPGLSFENYAFPYGISGHYGLFQGEKTENLLIYNFYAYKSIIHPEIKAKSLNIYGFVKDGVFIASRSKSDGSTETRAYSILPGGQLRSDLIEGITLGAYQSVTFSPDHSHIAVFDDNECLIYRIDVRN